MPRQMQRESVDDAGTLLVPTGWQTKFYVLRGTADGNFHVIYDAHREKESLAQAAQTWFWWTFCDGKKPFLGYITPVTELAYKPAAAVCQTFFSEWLHTKFKNDLKIEAIDDNPESIPYLKADTARSGLDPNKVDVSAAWITFSYNEKGRRFRERALFYVSHANDIKSSFLSGPPLWYGCTSVYYRAPVEEFDALEPILAGIIDSYKENPTWYPRMQQEIAQTVAYIQADIQNRQADIHNRLNQISQTYSETSDIIIQSYNHNQQIMDNVSHVRSNAMLGLQDVADTSGAVYNVPNNYEQYWTDGLNNIYAGDWQVTPDPTWTRLTPTGQ
jgi:hypothetical protein